MIATTEGIICTGKDFCRFYMLLFYWTMEGKRNKWFAEGGNLIISNSNINMASSRTYTKVRSQASSYKGLTIMLNNSLNGAQNTDKSQKNEKNGNTSENRNRFKDSMPSLMDRFNASSASIRRTTPDKLEQDAMSRIRTECLNFLLQMLFGRTSSAHKIDLSSGSADTGENSSNAFTVMSYSEEYHSYESEETAFSTEGKVVTSDGREISFGLELSMSRSFEEYYEANYDIVSEMCDPLVINLDTDIASVSDQKFYFDLDADGEMDNISILDSKSGYLALDKNADGIINDGSELFGTASGDGFRDLSQYDSDGNGWIDEADDIWDKLLIYVQGKDGSQELYKLSEKGVGAIYLGNASTDFSLNNMTTNAVNGAIRRTGIFLYENGNVGTMQHLDLAK